jgi:hypothetical protein
MYRALVITLLLVSYADRGQERGGARATDAAPVVMRILSQAHVSASLEYWGRCEPDHQLPDFPKLHASEKNLDSPVEALRDIFSGDDPEMRVTQEPDGTIRMAETDIPQDILDVRISHISFKATYDESWGVHYDQRFALAAILSSPEVRAFIKTQNITQQSEFATIIGGSQESVRKLANIPGDLDNVTVSQALDHVLKTFPGLWVYENCPSQKGKRMIYFKFF